jgi:hypothetical protein
MLTLFTFFSFTVNTRDYRGNHRIYNQLHTKFPNMFSCATAHKDSAKMRRYSDIQKSFVIFLQSSLSMCVCWNLVITKSGLYSIPMHIKIA